MIIDRTLRSLFFLLGFVAAVVLVAPVLAEDGDPLAAAREALDAGRWAEAEAAFRALTEASPGLVDAWRGLAQSLAGQGRRPEAAVLLARLGEGLLGAGRHAAAAAALEEAVALAPSPPLLALLGKAHLFAQDHLAAIAPLERAVELGETSIETRLYLAAALWETERLAEAEAIYRRLVETAPSFVALHQLGRLLDWQGRHAEAVPFLERAAALRPRAGDVAFDLAKARTGAGELEAAAVAYRRAVELEPGNYQAYYGLARVYLRQGEREKASEAMTTYQRLYAAERQKTQRDGLERARLDRGWELLAAGDAEAAERQFGEIGEVPEALAGLATAAARRGEHRRAALALARAVALAPDRQDLRLLLAEARMALGETP